LKAVTLTQPWASAIALGHKRIETRSWGPHYRGPIAIHAATALPLYARRFAETERALGRCPARLPLGAIVATAELVDVLPTQEALARGLVSALERLYGDFSAGRFAWFLANVTALAIPVPARGSLSLWNWEVPR